MLFIILLIANIFCDFLYFFDFSIDIFVQHVYNIQYESKQTKYIANISNTKMLNT